MTIPIGMVAGEPSGDLLAARIIHGLQQANAKVLCQGIGGPHMQEAGFTQWEPMDALSVFGYVDALKRLPTLIATYKRVQKRWLTQPPAAFVGIDAPDFNLRIQEKLKAAGIPTVQFVSPSIWAWRYERINKIRDAVSHMLVLFPFEEALYQREGIPVTYVGHPMAQQIPLEPESAPARRALGIPENVPLLAVLPGSRASEIKALAPRFLAAVQQLQHDQPDLHIAIPMVNAKRQQEFQKHLHQFPIKHCQLVEKSWTVLAAADAVLTASGTATLEAALFKQPMVISYVLSPLMRKIMAWQSGQDKPLLPWVGLPNILAQEGIVPELLQEQARPDTLAEATYKALNDANYRTQLQERYISLHHMLKRDTAGLAAKAILREADVYAG